MSGHRVASARPAVAARVVTAVWLAASAVQIIVWLLIVIVGGNWVAPWWLWTVGLGAAAVAAVWWFIGPAGRRTGAVGRAGSERGAGSQS